MAIYTDNFLDTSKTLLTSHTPSAGAAWEAELACNTFPDNRMRAGVASTLTRMRKTDDLGDDEMIVAIYGRLTTGTTIWGVCARMAAADYTDQYEAYVNNITSVRLDSVVAGVRVNVASAAVTPNTSNDHVLIFAVGNGTQRVWLDGVLVIDAANADAVLAGNTRGGLVILGSGSDASNNNMVWYLGTTGIDTLTPPADVVGDEIDAVLTLAQTQVDAIEARLTELRSPKQTDPGLYGNYEDISITADWTSGYFPTLSAALHLYEDNATALNSSISRYRLLTSNATRTTDPDTTSMCFEPMYELFSRYGLIHAKRNALTSCKSLMTTSWNNRCGVFQHFWPSGDVTVIADSITMCWPLFWAANNGSPAYFAERAARHFANAEANHVRSDGSTYHMVEYSSTTGAVVSKASLQGVGTESTWSRGQAWAMYGFIRAYQHTGNHFYLQTARRLCAYTLANLPAAPLDTTPPWDFNDPALSSPQIDTDKDTSAGAVMGYALLLMSDLESSRIRGRMYRAAGQQLIVDVITNHIGDAGTGEALLLHGTRAEGEQDMSLIYADTFLVLSLIYYMADLTTLPAVGTATRSWFF